MIEATPPEGYHYVLLVDMYENSIMEMKARFAEKGLLALVKTSWEDGLPMPGNTLRFWLRALPANEDLRYAVDGLADRAAILGEEHPLHFILGEALDAETGQMLWTVTIDRRPT